MRRFILIFFLFQTISSNSQRILSASGVSVSSLDQNMLSPTYGGIIVRPSISIGFETKQWKRLSITTLISNFTSGGNGSHQEHGPYYIYNKMIFNNYSIGATGNYYIVNKKTQFYLGIGPRLDYVRSDREIYNEWDGDSYIPQFLRKFVFGASGSIGVNFQLENFNLGIKSNYYYRPYLYKKGYEDFSGKKFHYIRDNIFDLQLVFGYTFGKKKAD
jgi:hypothetical protein